MSSLGQNLLEQAKTGLLNPLIGREKEIERILRTLGRFTGGHVLLVGECGVGKSALVSGVAQLIAGGVLEIDEVVRMKQSDFAEFVLNPIRLLKLSEKQTAPTIICVDHFECLVEFAGKSGRFSAIYDLLSHPAYRLLASTTPTGHQRILETVPALARGFQVIKIVEPDESATIQILRSLKIKYEQFHKVWIDDSALEMAVILSEKYLPDRKQPSKALDLLDEACSMVALRRAAGSEALGSHHETLSEEVIEDLIIRSPVTAFEVTEVVADITGQTVEDLEKELDAEE